MAVFLFLDKDLGMWYKHKVCITNMFELWSDEKKWAIVLYPKSHKNKQITKAKSKTLWFSFLCLFILTWILDQYELMTYTDIFHL